MNIFSNSFKTRLRVGIGIILIVLTGAFTPGACGLRIVYIFAAIMSLVEVNSLAMTEDRFSWGALAHAGITAAILIFSVAAVWIMPRALLIIGIVLTFASDVGAYVFGKLFGTRFIHAKPLPNISPNKSWEGFIGGIIFPTIAVIAINKLFQSNQPLPIPLGSLAGFWAIVGDANESAIKRRFGTKDANDHVKNHPYFDHIESWLGGSDGHGGYFDRLDSMSLVLLLFGVVTALSMLLPRT